MPTPEALQRFVRDVEQHISELDKINKDYAQQTLDAIADSYRQKVVDIIAAETAAIDECRKIGDETGAKHHAALVEIYRSLLNIYPATK